MILECIDGPLDGLLEEFLPSELRPQDGDVRTFRDLVGSYPNTRWRTVKYIVVDGKLLWTDSRLLWKSA